MQVQERELSYPGITSVSAGGTYPPACIVGTSVNTETQIPNNSY